MDLGGEWWRIVTSGFLHYGLFHIAFNMYALWIFGPTFERSMGRARFVLAYVACLLGGSLGALIASPTALTAGASGAIFGLLGIAVMSQRSLGISIWDSGLGTVLVLNFALTFGIGNISVGGHLGGFLVGLVAGWLCYELPRHQRLPRGAWRERSPVSAWPASSLRSGPPPPGPTRCSDRVGLRSLLARERGS